jgi:hypothetical protein
MSTKFHPFSYDINFYSTFRIKKVILVLQNPCMSLARQGWIATLSTDEQMGPYTCKRALIINVAKTRRS